MKHWWYCSSRICLRNCECLYQDEVHLWHPYFRSGIAQTTPGSFVHSQHSCRKLPKFFSMLLWRFYLFYSKKKHSITYFFSYFAHFQINMTNQYSDLENSSHQIISWNVSFQTNVYLITSGECLTIYRC